MTDGIDRRSPMQIASHVEIEVHPNGVFLIRFTEDRRVVGDTWHLTVEDAKHQAEFEFGASLGAWNVE